jgi:hypothetical protein
MLFPPNLKSMVPDPHIARQFAKKRTKMLPFIEVQSGAWLSLISGGADALLFRIRRSWGQAPQISDLADRDVRTNERFAANSEFCGARPRWVSQSSARVL